MPIDVKELARAQVPVAERILEHLAAHPKEAFSLVEIFAACEGYDKTTAALTLIFANQIPDHKATVAAYVQALNELDRRGAILSADVRGIRHYAAKSR